MTNIFRMQREQAARMMDEQTRKYVPVSEAEKINRELDEAIIRALREGQAA